MDDSMQYRKLGDTELVFSVVGVGTWAMGGSGWKFSWGPQDDEQSIRTIRKALDAGINWIDTAAVYGLGHSEEVVGRALAGMRERPFVATKCGRIPKPDGSLISRISRESIREEAENSLRRLQTDAIDLYQIHWPDPEEQIEEAWQTMADLVQEGKIRYAGVSNFNPTQIKRILPIHPVASVQPPYSMLRRDVEAELLPFCRENRIGVVVYSPMQKGLLTGKITHERMASLPADDHRRRDPMFNDPQLTRILKLVEGLRPIAETHGMTLAQLAVAWTLRRPEVTSAIVGMRSPEQAAELTAAGEQVLHAEEIQTIENLAESLT
jgi:aryl-alcohol dehydrogenase-like predicted oxidoreductase